MGCPYCYLAVRLRLPCPCSLYHTTASLNSASSSPPLASVSANLQTNTEMVRETEKIRDGERATSARGVWSLSEFPSVSPLQFPLICWNYPISPSLYFGENAFYLNSTHTTNQSLKCATFRGVSPGGAQLHPEMASPFRVESARLHAEKREHEPYRLNRNNTLTVAEKTQNGRTANHENAWGGPTYTELITEAILSTRDHRMTLSQIYDWITENVEYFRERKNFTSARGWKNAIRHTLSLRKRFRRVARTTGAASWYNSWWMIKEKQMSRRRISKVKNMQVGNKTNCSM